MYLSKKYTWLGKWYTLWYLHIHILQYYILLKVILIINHWFIFDKINHKIPILKKVFNYCDVLTVWCWIWKTRTSRKKVISWSIWLHYCSIFLSSFWMLIFRNYFFCWLLSSLVRDYSLDRYHYTVPWWWVMFNTVHQVENSFWNYR